MFVSFHSFTGAGCVIGVFGLYMGKNISRSEKYEATGNTLIKHLICFTILSFLTLTVITFI